MADPETRAPQWIHTTIPGGFGTLCGKRGLDVTRDGEVTVIGGEPTCPACLAKMLPPLTDEQCIKVANLLRYKGSRE
jgi:hypothetical protein